MDAKLKGKNIDHHGPRTISHIYHLPDPPLFSLPTTLQKKLTENSASLTGCKRLTCKGDGKLFRHEDRVNPTSSDDEDGIFRNQRNFPIVNLTNSDYSDLYIVTQIGQIKQRKPTHATVPYQAVLFTFRMFGWWAGRQSNFPPHSTQKTRKTMPSHAHTWICSKLETTTFRVLDKKNRKH